MMAFTPLRRLLRSSLVPALLGILPYVAWAEQQPHPIGRSIWLQVTPSGQRLIEENLLSVIEGTGFSVRSNTIPSISYRADSPFTLDQLPSSTPPADVKALTLLRDEIKKWLLGVELADPLLQAEVKNLAYDVNFDRLSLKVLGRNATQDGIRLRLEIEVPDLQVRAERITARDLNNDWLGIFGVNQLVAQLGSKENPTLITGEFEVRVQPVGHFELKIISLLTNLGSVPASLEFSPNFIFPDVEIRVNGHEMKLNPAPIADLIQQQKGALTQALQKYLETLIQENLSRWVDKGASRISITDLRDAIPIPAPGAPDQLDLAQRQLLFGFFPEKIGITDDGSVRLSASSFVEDMISGPNAGGPVLPYAAHSPRLPTTISHDFAVALHPSILNRMLALSHDRGFFQEVKLSDGSSIELYESPRFDLDRRVPQGMLRIRLAIKKASGGGLKRLFVNKDVLLKFDGFVKVVRNEDASFSLVLQSVDLQSLTVDDSSATLGIFKGLVRSKVLEQLTAFGEELKTNPLMLAAQIRPTEQMLGLKWKLVNMDTEPSTGFITGYFEFVR